MTDVATAESGTKYLAVNVQQAAGTSIQAIHRRLTRTVRIWANLTTEPAWVPELGAAREINWDGVPDNFSAPTGGAWCSGPAGRGFR